MPRSLSKITGQPVSYADGMRHGLVPAVCVRVVVFDDRFAIGGDTADFLLNTAFRTSLGDQLLTLCANTEALNRALTTGRRMLRPSRRPRTMGDMIRTAYLALVLAVVGCDGSTVTDAGTDGNLPALFFDVQYAVRCDETAGCAGRTDVDVCGFVDGDACEGVSGLATGSCDAAGGLVSFVTSQGGPVLSVNRLPIGGSGGECTVLLEIDGATYSGACGSGSPSPAVPCQITNVTSGVVMGNHELEGQIFCVGLSGGGAISREITAVGAGPSPAFMPGRFRVANCRGL